MAAQRFCRRGNAIVVISEYCLAKRAGPATGRLAETLVPHARSQRTSASELKRGRRDIDHRDWVDCTGRQTKWETCVGACLWHLSFQCPPPNRGCEAEKASPQHGFGLECCGKRARLQRAPKRFERPGGPFPNLTAPCASTTFICDAIVRSLFSASRVLLSGNNGRRSHDAIGKCLCPRGRARERFGSSGSSKLITDWPLPHVELCRGPTS